MSLLTDEGRRLKAFTGRKRTLVNKANELVRDCGAKVAIYVMGEHEETVSAFQSHVDFPIEGLEDQIQTSLVPISPVRAPEGFITLKPERLQLALPPIPTKSVKENSIDTEDDSARKNKKRKRKQGAAEAHQEHFSDSDTSTENVLSTTKNASLPRGKPSALTIPAPQMSGASSHFQQSPFGAFHAQVGGSPTVVYAGSISASSDVSPRTFIHNGRHVRFVSTNQTPLSPFFSTTKTFQGTIEEI